MTTRVLLIEDDEDDEDDYLLTLDCIEMIADAEYSVEWVSNGVEAVDGSIDFSKFDVVLCDYRVGSVTGDQIVMAAIAHGVETPFILLMGISDRDVDHAAMRAGAVDHLVKDGISGAVLEKAIRYAVNAAKAAKAHRKQSEILKSALAASDVGLAAIESDGDVPIWNQHMTDMLLVQADDLAGIKAEIVALADTDGL
ncbi:MAG: response regulator, partial [Alphaproteobacteria bacterium]